MGMIDLLFIPALSALDRLRGSAVGIGKTPEAILYGAVTGWLLFGGGPLGLIIGFAILFAIGTAPGWGQPIGWLISGTKSGDYEWWQKGVLQTQVHLAVIVRGLLWALPTAPLVYFDLRVLAFLVAMPMAFYLAALLAKALLRKTVKAWEAHEFLRGALLASGLLVWPWLLTQVRG